MDKKRRKSILVIIAVILIIDVFAGLFVRQLLADKDQKDNTAQQRNLKNNDLTSEEVLENASLYAENTMSEADEIANKSNEPVVILNIDALNEAELTPFNRMSLQLYARSYFKHYAGDHVQYNITLDENSLKISDIYTSIHFTVAELPGYEFRCALYQGNDNWNISCKDYEDQHS